MVTATRAAPVLFLTAGGHWLGGAGHLGSLRSSCWRGRGHSGGAGGALGSGLLGRGWQQTPSPCWRSPASGECSAAWWQGHSGRSRWCTCHVPGVALMLPQLCQSLHFADDGLRPSGWPARPQLVRELQFGPSSWLPSPSASCLTSLCPRRPRVPSICLSLCPTVHRPPCGLHRAGGEGVSLKLFAG